LSFRALAEKSNCLLLAVIPLASKGFLEYNKEKKEEKMGGEGLKPGDGVIRDDFDMITDGTKESAIYYLQGLADSCREAGNESSANSFDQQIEELKKGNLKAGEIFNLAEAGQMEEIKDKLKAEGYKVKPHVIKWRTKGYAELTRPHGSWHDLSPEGIQKHLNGDERFPNEDDNKEFELWMSVHGNRQRSEINWLNIQLEEAKRENRFTDEEIMLAKRLFEVEREYLNYDNLIKRKKAELNYMFDVEESSEDAEKLYNIFYSEGETWDTFAGLQ